MVVAGVLVAMLLLAWWEAPNLRQWRAGERWAFWVFWALMLIWGSAAQLHARLPTLPDLTDQLFGSWARALLTPSKNIFW